MLYLLEDAIDGPLVHLAGDGVLPQASSHGAQVVQRRHSQRHLRLLVTELVNLVGAETQSDVSEKCNPVILFM